MLRKWFSVESCVPTSHRKVARHDRIAEICGTVHIRRMHLDRQCMEIVAARVIKHAWRLAEDAVAEYEPRFRLRIRVGKHIYE